MLGDPDYNSLKMYNEKEFERMDKNEDVFNILFYSYSVLVVDFLFGSETKYPTIPVKMSEDITVYPLSGKDILITGTEFLAAKEVGCNLKVKQCISIPFKGSIVKSDSESMDIGSSENITISGFKYKNPPYTKVIKELQSLRRKYPKHSAMERMYKDIGNMAYGACVSGLSNKEKFNPRTGNMTRIKGSDLSNPIVGGWITGTVRALIGETLNNIDILKGNVTSVTTDGFVTDIEDLESKIICNEKTKRFFFDKYRKTRTYLTDISGNTVNEQAFEVKTVVKGICQ
jgi:hypothetical protein